MAVYSTHLSIWRFLDPTEAPACGRLARELDFRSSKRPPAAASPAAELSSTLYGSVDGSLYTQEELLAVADAPPASPTNGQRHASKTSHELPAAGCCSTEPSQQHVPP